MTNLKVLHNEYAELKGKLFANCMFAADNGSEDWQRYNQLFQFFHPQYRTKEYKSPANS